MISTIVIDQDQKNIGVLTSLLDGLPSSIEIIKSAVNVDQAAGIVSKIQPDLVFLEVELPFGNGFDLLDRLMPVTFEVIFITAFSQHSLKAMRYGALDYLLKPVDNDELQNAVQRAENKINLKNSNDRVLNLQFNSRRKVSASRIAFPVKNGFEFVSTNDIVYCHTDKNFTFVHTQQGKKYICDRKIKEYEDLLPEESFSRIHHSYIINVNYIKKFIKEGRGGYLELTDGSTIPVASRRKDVFLSKFI
jgi:two-component system, LytTR family, response regulator